ncbi:MAG TPA: SDR family oxidoreductase [Rhizobiales bacterium]|nr:SDR family oxidoreductase [Hyphomicrobiales bacterium]
MARIVITGANRGIGLELAKLYKSRGDQVAVACRQSSPELDELGLEVHAGVELTNDASVAAFAALVGRERVDVLINNAGLLTRETLDDLDFGRMLKQYEVNALAPLRMTKAMLPLMGQGGKVAILSSRVGSMADNGSGGNYGYRMSKAAVNMAGVNLAHDLKPLGIAVVLLHPGYVRTGMTGGSGNIDPEEAARGLIARIDDTTLENTAKFWHAEGYELPW